ncbi:hypothetical protein GQ44DRAFT_687098 [Phaeosphaeriaceae sp. PMI808]|nr:hypothetical protein GQ44DRAFT_687098 [Phaeosphaeriaceae sp. PMI808]
MSCNFITPLFTRRKKKSDPLEPIPIEIRQQLPNNTEAWRLAILSYDPNFESNMISQKLVINVLGAPIQPFDEESTTHGKDRINVSMADGYVDLVWCCENNSKQIHKSRFLVASCYNPPYDAVLGRKDGEHFGILESKNRR